MPRYLINTVSIFRMTYIIDAPNVEWAKDAIVMNEVEDADQDHLDELIVDSREITIEEFNRIISPMANGHMGEKIVHVVEDENDNPF